MSFMFKPLAYDDTQAVNRIALPGGIGRQVLTDSKAIADRLVAAAAGEQARISSKSHPEFSYTARFLDVVTIPATIEDYEIRAEGYQPVVIHKTLLREGYTRYKNPAYKDRTVEKG